ncbi:uncharacterized protein I303_101519 [Kwoniella dejecticola CBS 10117]|uniref:Uncharacterized protein n=1 Tax=Kwoniella dejecticola CBS 10117 TaxID=1296121 RepID=A0A1A6ADL2_9TREE|nr:uncharacterized protein I303_02349 [Kwoniella dejecticola CBS 10117]OBR88129.1 hypothetical protein I303_02349 [Kwoniella dejecticola CBS 10117]
MLSVESKPVFRHKTPLPSEAEVARMAREGTRLKSLLESSDAGCPSLCAIKKASAKHILPHYQDRLQDCTELANTATDYEFRQRFFPDSRIYDALYPATSRDDELDPDRSPAVNKGYKANYDRWFLGRTESGNADQKEQAKSMSMEDMTLAMAPRHTTTHSGYDWASQQEPRRPGLLRRGSSSASNAFKAAMGTMSRRGSGSSTRI